jgi:acid phosphatase (class A)
LRASSLLRTLLLAVVAAPLLQSCTSTQARVMDLASPYIDARKIDLRTLLPPPPTDNSETTRAETTLILKLQADIAPERAERVRADAEASIYRFADALDHPEAFTRKQLPRTHALFRKVTYEQAAVVHVGKNAFERKRPFRSQSAIEPIVDQPRTLSYPSGHSMWARTVGLLLADMLPEYRERIMTRADEYAFNRVIAGVHYPSDIEGGKLAGTALTAFLLASPEFQEDYAEAKKELRGALGLRAIQ